MHNIDLHVLPRATMTWDEFVKSTPPYSIALDGVVTGGPLRDLETMHLNFDHHNKVIRDATMSTSKQVYYAIKGTLMKHFHNGTPPHVYVNDSDQDVSLAVWQLENHKLFEGTNSIPNISRLLELTDQLDITGGAFPLQLDEELLQQHNWIFAPYTFLRKTGALFTANEAVLRDNIEMVMKRISTHMMGQSQRVALDTRHEIIYREGGFVIAHEIGGPESRYQLYSDGMEAFVNLIAERPDGRKVWTAGKLSPYVPFNIIGFYKAANKAEGLRGKDRWNGSDLIGSSPRRTGSGLKWERIKDIATQYYSGD